MSQTQWVGNAGDGRAGQPDGGQEDHPEASNEGELLILLGLGEKWVLPEPREREIWLELKIRGIPGKCCEREGQTVPGDEVIEELHRGCGLNRRNDACLV